MSEKGSSSTAHSCDEIRIFHPKVAKFSATAFQITNPGIQDDFTITKDFTIENIEEYMGETFYSIYSDFKKLYFVCLNCASSRMNKISFYNHLKNRKHRIKLQPFSELTSFVKICDICQVLLLGSHFELLQQHFISCDHKHTVKCRMEFIKQQYAENSGDMKLGWNGKLTEKCRNMFSSEDGLNHCIESSLNVAENLIKHLPLVHGIVEKDIRNILEPIYGTMDIQFFGSRIYGLAQRDSDIDIYLNLGLISIEDLEENFSKYTSVFIVKDTVKQARIPIIKVEHIYTALNCDINCRDSAAVYNSELIRVYISLDYRVQWVLMAVREWATANHIRGTQKFTSYSLAWLALFFMMQPDINLVPPVQLLKDLHEGPTTYINGWNYSFTNHIDSIKLHCDPSSCTKTKYEILFLFFQYYAILNAKKVALFPLTGEVVPRSALLSADSYFCPELSLNTEDKEPIKIGGQYVLLDCFRLKENVLKNVEENLADHFRLICSKTVEESCWKV